MSWSCNCSSQQTIIGSTSSYLHFSLLLLSCLSARTAQQHRFKEQHLNLCLPAHLPGPSWSSNNNHQQEQQGSSSNSRERRREKAHHLMIILDWSWMGPMVVVVEGSRGKTVEPFCLPSLFGWATESNKSWPDNNFTGKRSIKLSNEVSIHNYYSYKTNTEQPLLVHWGGGRVDWGCGGTGKTVVWICCWCCCCFVVVFLRSLVMSCNSSGQVKLPQKRMSGDWREHGAITLCCYVTSNVFLLLCLLSLDSDKLSKVPAYEEETGWMVKLSRVIRILCI